MSRKIPSELCYPLVHPCLHRPGFLSHRNKFRGYALFVVLALMALLFILTTAISLNVKTETGHGALLLAEEEALNGADSGIQYALESIRQHQTLPSTYGSAPWNPIQTQGGTNVCFKVYENDLSCPAGDRCVTSYGEAVKGQCGDYQSGLDRIEAARKVNGTVDASNGTVVAWEEVLP